MPGLSWLPSCTMTAAASMPSALIWAIGTFGHNPHQSSKGKSTLIVALVASLLVGGAAYLVGWFNDRGKEVSAPASVVHTVALFMSRAGVVS